MSGAGYQVSVCGLLLTPDTRTPDTLALLISELYDLLLHSVLSPVVARNI